MPRLSLSRPDDAPDRSPAAGFAGDGWEGLAAVPRGVSPQAWSVVGAAARRAVAEWGSGAGVVTSPEEAVAVVRRVCLAVRESLEGATPDFRDVESLIPLRPPLDAVRRAFLAEVRDAYGRLGMEEVLRVLEALEGAQRALDENAAQRFADRMAGSDALGLVVEVAHDMRSPLGSILFLAERLRKGQSGPVDPVQERQLGLIYSAAFGLSSLASDVMELARGGARLIGPHPIAFSIAEIFGAVHDILRPMAEEKRLELRFVPPEGDWRIGHPSALNRVILNLATNALKFTNEGSVEVRAVPHERNRVEFAVLDTGRGIPESVLATLFDSFRRRARGDSYAFSSAGLGLSICQKLIRGMGGELGVETELERGTRFSFEVELPPAPRM